VLGNKEENTRQNLEALAAHLPVWMSDIQTLTDALDMIRTVGQLTGREQPAATLATGISADFAQLPATPFLGSALYLIWNNPVMAAGGGTFIHDLLSRCGFRNVLADRQRYPVLTAEELRQLHPDTVLLSSEPFPFRRRHADAFRAIFPAARIVHVDGELFSWYGSRLKMSPAYFRALARQIQTGF